MKITINNEEVLCNKDFTINEEMLNTSSVILNNVYPKTWEQNKDYVSRFYYPKDYSKCKIFDEIVHPTTRQDIEGTNFSINVDTSKEYEIQTLKGQTTQTGTPTPSSPQPINITTGRQVVSTQQGNQLFNKNNPKILNAKYGTTIIADNNERMLYIPCKPNTTYTLYHIATTPMRNSIGTTQTLPSISTPIENGVYSSTSPKTITTNANAKYIVWQFYAMNDTTHTLQQVLDSIMINEGATALPYEEYKGNDYEINLGKNMLNPIGVSQTYGGITFTNNGDGTFTANGTATANGSFLLTNLTSSPITLEKNQSYTQTLEIISGTWGGSIVPAFKNSSGTISYNYFNSSASSPVSTKTTTDYMTCYTYSFYITTGNTITNCRFRVQLEKGSQFTGYTPYKTPIYLGKIGTYQDYIFRNTQDNPLYDSNLEEGQWYIHKEIGRVVLNGSENWSYISVAQGILYRNNTIITNAKDDRTYAPLCNYFRGIPLNQQPNRQDGDIYINAGSNVIDIIDNIHTTSTIFKNFLASHNVEVYYVLNTPTNTLIEDEELINQLNSIELLEGLNNVSVSSPYLPFIMSLMYNYEEGYTEEELYFCGVVENTGNISLNPRHPHYCNLQVLDFKTFLSEGETLDIVIYEKTILEAIEQIIGVIAPYGFVKGNINIYHADEMIGAYSTKDKTAYDVFNYIADITQSRWTTRMVDENTIAIDFYDPNLMPQGTAIQYNNTWFTNNKIIDMNFNYSSRDYRNKQVMLSGEVYSNVETTEIMVADGYQTQFNTTGKIGYVSNVLLNGTPASIITKEEYDLGYDGDFIYQPGNTYFESENLIPNGAIITIVYYAIIEGREVLLNQDEIEKINTMTNRKGVVARYETRNDATTTKELNQIGQSYLKYKGMPEITLKVESLENIWNIGERVEFNSPLEELSTEYMVKKKSINYITTQDNLFYTFELSSNFNSETEINYFDNQRAKTIGNIGSGEFISRNIDIENTANVIFYGLEVNEVQISGESTLQSELQTPLGVE